MASQVNTVFRWTIKHFDMLPHSNGEYLESPAFSVGSYKFRVHLYPRGYESDDYVSVFLRRTEDCGSTEVSIDHEVYIVDNDGYCKLIGKASRIFEKMLLKNTTKWGIAKFIERSSFLTTLKPKSIEYDNLIIEYRILSLNVIESKEDKNRICDEKDSESLSRDFAELLKNEINSDMTIIADDIYLKVHRAVLEYRCPKLIAKLSKTRLPNVFRLIGAKSPELRILFQYLYSGIFSDCNMYNEIFTASSTYSLPEFRVGLLLPYANSVSASTEMNISRATFRWIIPDFSKLQLDQALTYPVFCHSTSGTDEIKMMLNIAKRNKSENLELKFKKMCLNIAFMRCKISIFETVSSVIPITVQEYEHAFKTDNWITPLALESNLSGIIFKDTLNMLFEISLANGEALSQIDEVTVESKTQAPGVEVVKDIKLLQQNLDLLYNEQKYSDITLCVGDVKLQAHKAILCARSPVFSKMFEHDTSEKKDGVIVIKDMDPETVSFMLRYIYCGYVDEMDISKAITRYAAADKYELLVLKDKCSTFLQSSIDAEHIGDILLLADAHHDEALKKSVYDYIASNPRKVLRSKKGLGILKSRLDVYPDILNVLLEHMSKGGKSSSDSDD